MATKDQTQTRSDGEPIPAQPAAWWDRYGVLFHRLRPAEVQALSEMLDLHFPRRHGGEDNWTADELIMALDRIAEDQRKAGGKVESPHFPQIKSAIIKARYEAKRTPEQVTTACPWCRQSGWLGYRPNLPEAYTIQQWGDAYSVSVPCVCAAGDAALSKLMATVKPHEWQDAGDNEQNRREHLRRSALLAIEQARRLDGLA